MRVDDDKHEKMVLRCMNEREEITGFPEIGSAFS